MDLKLIMQLDAEEEMARDSAALREFAKRDLVEVVRCGECDMNTEFGCALLNGLMVSKDFYCANGVRKGE